MRIRVALTVEIDPQSWCEEYGVERSEVREDVQRYVENLVQEQLGAVCGMRP